MVRALQALNVAEDVALRSTAKPLSRRQVDDDSFAGIDVIGVVKTAGPAVQLVGPGATD
jgi:hypothetical protein